MRRGENIYKRRDGRWEGRYIASRDASGKAFYRSVYATTYQEVREKLKSCPESCRSGRSAAFEEVASNWLAGVKLRCKLSTYNKYLNTYHNHLLPEFRGYLISEISNKQVESMISSKTKYSEKTRTDILSILKQILKHARHSGLQVDTTIADLSVHSTKKEIRVLTGEEQESLETQLLKDNALIPAGIYLALYTGLRIGELCALKRSGIDLKTGIAKSKNMTLMEIDRMLNKVLPNVNTDLKDAEIADLLLHALEYREYDVQELRIPVFGYFTNEVINSMAVLVFDPEANAAFIRKVVYEDCKDADEAIAEYEKEK